MKKVLVLINSKSRSGAEARNRAHQMLEQAGYEIIHPRPETDVDPNSFILQHRHEAECIFIGGGDGSINAALPALVETQIPLLIFPLGTANNLARTYQIPNDLSECLEILRSGHDIQVDLGEVNGIYFVNVAGLGLSTEVNRLVSPRLKKTLGVLAFVWTAFKVALRMKPFPVTIETPHQKIQSRSWQISVCNGRHYGNGLVIEKDATLDDGKLHCLSTEVPNLWKGLKLAPALLTGRYRYDHEISLVSGSQIEIRTSRPRRVDVDGDIKTQTPARFLVHRQLLKLRVPTQADSRPRSTL